MSSRSQLVQFWRALQSRDLAFILLAVIAGAVMLTLLIPQRSHLSPAQYAAWREGARPLGGWLETFGLTDIYSSWWFLTTVALVLVSTLACTVTRFGQELRRVGRDWGRLRREEIERLPEHGDVFLRQAQDAPLGPLGTQGLRRVARWLESKGWLVRWELAQPQALDTASAISGEQSVIASEAKQSVGGVVPDPAPASASGTRPTTAFQDTEIGYIFADKGWASSLGSIVFHLSLLVIALGVVYSQVVRQEGSMIITEGTTVTEQRPDYLMIKKMPLLGEDYRAFQVRLDRFVPTYHQGWTPVDAVAEMTILDEGRTIRRQVVRVNEPLEYKGVSFVMEQYGFAPQFILKGPAGEEIFNNYVNLVVAEPGSADSFEVAEAGLSIRTRFFPHQAEEEGSLTTLSLEPKNPVFDLQVSRGGQVVFAGTVGLNQSVSVGEYTLSFADLDYWATFRVIKDPGMWLVFLGLWVGLGGLVLRYLYNRRRLWGCLYQGAGGPWLALGGRAEQFGAIFGEEFQRLLAELRKEVSSGLR